MTGSRSKALVQPRKAESKKMLHHGKEYPPSTIISSPVVYVAASLARYRYAPLSSTTCPALLHTKATLAHHFHSTRDAIDCRNLELSLTPSQSCPLGWKEIRERRSPAFRCGCIPGTQYCCERSRSTRRRDFCLRFSEIQVSVPCYNGVYKMAILGTVQK